MTAGSPFDPAVFAAQDVHCPACHWTGKGADCQLRPNDLAACPQCGRTVRYGLSQTRGVESGWDFEQGDLAKFGANSDGLLWLGIGKKLPGSDLFGGEGAGSFYVASAIPLKEAAGFARRMLRVLELAGYQGEEGKAKT